MVHGGIGIVFGHFTAVDHDKGDALGECADGGGGVHRQCRGDH